jgi:Dolichyl-phosphate-mannose-protein mannosyltransferase
MPAHSSRTRSAIAVFLLVWLLSIVYLAANLNRGWVPHDEGILGQSAERVLHGELPHRDFNEPYTGGLAFLDAAAFHLFGIRLMVLRWVLFAFFLLWVPVVFAIAREFCGTWPAAGVTLLSVAWSVPNYPAAMPSWFCLFLATFGVLLLFRYLRTRHTAWLLLAGFCGGFSFLIKTPGIYFVAGVLLFLVYREQSLSTPPSVSPQAAGANSIAYRVFLTFSLVAFLIILILVAMPHGGVSEFLHFVLPSLAIVVLLFLREFYFAAPLASAGRFRQLFALIAPFLAGVALPVLAFFAYYARLGALHPLLKGLFVLQLRRLADARLSPPHWFFVLCAILLVALFLPTSLASRAFLPKSPTLKIRPAARPSELLVILKTLAAALLLFACLKFPVILIDTLDAIRGFMPLLLIVTVAILFFRQLGGHSSESDPRLTLLLFVTALSSLVQVPYAGPMYFCYFATLAFLMLAALLSLVPAAQRQAHSDRFHLSLAAAFFSLFAVLAFRPVAIAAFDFNEPRSLPGSPLPLDRARGLRVFPDQADRYNQLVPFVVAAAAGRPIFAGPDCPEIYFLSGLPNRTPYLFDFFVPPAQYQSDLQQLLDRADFIQVVVINNRPSFSRPHLAVLRSLVAARFPHSRNFGNFEAFWR